MSPERLKPWGLAQARRIRLEGLDLIPDLSGALWVPDYKTLLVADLHLEKATSLARRGALLPPYDSRTTLALLDAVVCALNPARVVLLGDSWHDDGGAARMGTEDAVQLARLNASADFVWLRGNHDKGSGLTDFTLGPLVLRHEPEPGAQGEIAGHLHPAASVLVRGTRIRRKCFAVSDNRIIMPAFGAFTGGLDVRHPAFEGLLPGRFCAWLLGDLDVFPVPVQR